MSDPSRIGLFLADDNLIVREGVRVLLEMEDDFEVLGTAEDYDGLVAGAEETAPQVVVTDIRMPPTFGREGIDAAKEVRKRHPGTGVVILSQYDDPDYAIALLSEGSAGYAYLLKDRVAEGDQLARAVREVASGGSMLDPKIVEALTQPVRRSDLSRAEENLLQQVAEGTPIKAIAVSGKTTPAAVATAVERLFVRLAEGLSAGDQQCLDRLKTLQQAIVDREEQGESISRLLPDGIAARLRAGGHAVGETERLDVTVLMSDIRGYCTIAEHTDPSALAGQLNTHRARMNDAIHAEGGTVMQFVGDAVMAVFGAPEPSTDHADRAVVAAAGMHRAQQEVNESFVAQGLEPFGLGIGLSTGEVAAALLGSEDRVEYSLVGDTVNLTQRLQQFAAAGETVLSAPTMDALRTPVDADELPPATVKGRVSAVRAFKVAVPAVTG
jgi:class 3 adenylate cyclase/ActR/RegA family two-component response regulator